MRSEHRHYGFEPAEIDALMGDLVDPEHDPADELPQLVSEPVSRLGDVWLLGEHRLCCGDATKETDIYRLLGGERAAMTFTDPPFNVRIRSVQGRGRIRHGDFLQGAGELSSTEFRRFLADSLGLAAKYSVSGSIHYVCMDWRHMGDILAAGQDVYSELNNVIVWVKTNAGQGSFYRSQHEFIFVFKNGEGSHLNNIELGRHGRNRSNVWTYAGVNTFRSGRLAELALHPTVKPVSLLADAMRDCSRRGDIVVDPFVGSGTTILAAERVGRRGYGLEIDARYVDAAIERWQHFTKRDAFLKGNRKQTFSDLMEFRRSQRRPPNA